MRKSLIFLTAFMVAGCSSLPCWVPALPTRARPATSQEKLVNEPNVAPIVFIADYASEAIEATGGMNVWMNTERLTLDGVVTVYEPNDSFYLTEHHFEVFPWSNSITISADEPLNRFVWQFSAGQFATLQGDDKKDVAPKPISYRDYAQAVLWIITAPMRLVDESADFTKSPEAVKIQGQWYYPIEQTRSIRPDGLGQQNEESAIPNQAQPYWSKVVFFQNNNSSIVDMIFFAKVDQNKFLAVRGYDYKEVVENGVLVPTRVEIFRTDARAVTEERLVKIDFH